MINSSDHGSYTWKLDIIENLYFDCTNNNRSETAHYV